MEHEHIIVCLSTQSKAQLKTQKNQQPRIHTMQSYRQGTVRAWQCWQLLSTTQSRIHTGQRLLFYIFQNIPTIFLKINAQKFQKPQRALLLAYNSFLNSTYRSFMLYQYDFAHFQFVLIHRVVEKRERNPSAPSMNNYNQFIKERTS